MVVPVIEAAIVVSPMGLLELLVTLLVHIVPHMVLVLDGIPVRTLRMLVGMAVVVSIVVLVGMAVLISIIMLVSVVVVVMLVSVIMLVSIVVVVMLISVVMLVGIAMIVVLVSVAMVAGVIVIVSVGLMRVVMRRRLMRSCLMRLMRS